MNILLINAHQKWENFAEGKLNKAFFDLANNTLKEGNYNIRTTTIDNGYVVDDELEKHIWSDAIIVQVPLYWMSSPWLFKKYVDEVLTAGLGGKLAYHDGRVIDDPRKRYGSGGVRDRLFMLSVTSNAPKYSFDENEFFEGGNIDHLFLWLHKAYQFNGFSSLPGFQAFDVMKNPDIDNDLIRYSNHLNEYFPRMTNY